MFGTNTARIGKRTSLFIAVICSVGSPLAISGAAAGAGSANPPPAKLGHAAASRPRRLRHYKRRTLNFRIMLMPSALRQARVARLLRLVGRRNGKPISIRKLALACTITYWCRPGMKWGPGVSGPGKIDVVNAPGVNAAATKFLISQTRVAVATFGFITKYRTIKTRGGAKVIAVVHFRIVWQLRNGAAPRAGNPKGGPRKRVRRRLRLGQTQVRDVVKN